MSKYTLEVDSEQLKHISKALDFFARIQTGQVSELVNPYMLPLPDADYKEVSNEIKMRSRQSQSPHFVFLVVDYFIKKEKIIAIKAAPSTRAATMIIAPLISPAASG